MSGFPAVAARATGRTRRRLANARLADGEPCCAQLVHGDRVLGGLVVGRHHGATVLFALVSFFALREFITLSPTRRGDHRSLVLAFFVVLPLQFWLVGTRHFDLFTVFIPVYVFLAIPVVSALANDPQRFLERNAKLQWGIMVCIYGMSHVPALLLLEFPGSGQPQCFPGVLPGAGGADLHGGAASGGAPLRPAPRRPTSAAASTGAAGGIGVARAACWAACWPASRRSSRGRRWPWPCRLRGRLAGPPGDEGAQARPRHSQLGRAGRCR
jgi:hypothetical protein